MKKFLLAGLMATILAFATQCSANAMGLFYTIHQLGGQAGKGHKTEIPARPYLQLTDDDFAEIIDETTFFLK